jgi:hypothetical protein
MANTYDFLDKVLTVIQQGQDVLNNPVALAYVEAEGQKKAEEKAKRDHVAACLRLHRLDGKLGLGYVKGSSTRYNGVIRTRHSEVTGGVDLFIELPSGALVQVNKVAY